MVFVLNNSKKSKFSKMSSNSSKRSGTSAAAAVVVVVAARGIDMAVRAVGPAVALVPGRTDAAGVALLVDRHAGVGPDRAGRRLGVGQDGAQDPVAHPLEQSLHRWFPLQFGSV